MAQQSIVEGWCWVYSPFAVCYKGGVREPVELVSLILYGYLLTSIGQRGERYHQ
jgi:hypothetical protein